jgi:hypothetical protein
MTNLAANLADTTRAHADRAGIMLPNRAGPREEAGSPPRAGQRSNPTERRHRLRGTALAI